MIEIIVPGIFHSHPNVRSMVSTRNGGHSSRPMGMNLSYRVGDEGEHVRQNRRLFLAKAGFSEETTAFAAQCHSSTVKTVESPGLFQDCDGLITRTNGLGLAISVADCVPILMFSPVPFALAAVHAGWKGTRSEIMRTALGAMVSLGVPLNELRMYIGPSAGPCCYDVGEEVAEQFRDEVVVRSEMKLTLDLPRENLLQATTEGVRSRHVEIDGRCTICHPELFHSYRRDGNRSGRMLAFIGSMGG